MNCLETDRTLNTEDISSVGLPLPNNQSYQRARDSKNYYLPLPIIRYDHAGDRRETAKNEHHRLSIY